MIAYILSVTHLWRHPTPHNAKENAVPSSCVPPVFIMLRMIGFSRGILVAFDMARYRGIWCRRRADLRKHIVERIYSGIEMIRTNTYKGVELEQICANGEELQYGTILHSSWRSSPSFSNKESDALAVALSRGDLSRWFVSCGYCPEYRWVQLIYSTSCQCWFGALMSWCGIKLSGTSSANVLIAMENVHTVSLKK